MLSSTGHTVALKTVPGDVYILIPNMQYGYSTVQTLGGTSHTSQDVVWRPQWPKFKTFTHADPDNELSTCDLSRFVTISISRLKKCWKMSIWARKKKQRKIPVRCFWVIIRYPVSLRRGLNTLHTQFYFFIKSTLDISTKQPNQCR